jgi:hypothetical protein
MWYDRKVPKSCTWSHYKRLHSLFPVFNVLQFSFTIGEPVLISSKYQVYSFTVSNCSPPTESFVVYQTLQQIMNVQKSTARKGEIMKNIKNGQGTNAPLSFKIIPL